MVRDCTSQPGDYVLSCRNKGQILHFVINKVPRFLTSTPRYLYPNILFSNYTFVPFLQIVLQPDTVYERVQYRFEEDSFDTVPDLITYYVGSGKPITAVSGARIQNPRNRVYPLSFYANKYEMQLHDSRLDLSTDTLCYRSPNGSPPRSRRDQHAHRLQQGKKQRSLSLLPGDTSSRNGNCSFSHSLPRRSFSSKIKPHSSNTTMPRNLRGPKARCGSNSDYSGVEPPPKPCRLVKTVTAQDDPTRKNSFYLASGSDSGNGSGDSVHSCNNGEFDCCGSTMQRRSSGVMIKNPKYYGIASSASSLTTLKAFSYDPLVDEMSPLSISSISSELTSAFDLGVFHTLLLPENENKPLDMTALQSIHMLVVDSGSRILANHLTRVDLELTIQQLREDADYMCRSGIELCVLPHGHRHRLDLIERYVDRS